MPLPDEDLELLRGNLNNIRVPGSNDNVFKDEDIFSFDRQVLGVMDDEGGWTRNMSRLLQCCCFSPYCMSLLSSSSTSTLLCSACSPFCKDGLYVCLKTWQGFSRHSLMLGLERGAGPCFLHEVWKRVPNKEQTTTGGEVEGTLEPAKLAIGVEGGFKTEDQQFQVVKEHWVVVLDGDANERLRFRCVCVCCITTSLASVHTMFENVLLITFVLL